jgi:excisionase family DNA binding protein
MDVREGMISADEAAKLLGFSRQHVLRLARAGLLPSAKYGRAVRFPLSELNKTQRRIKAKVLTIEAEATA